MKLIIDIPEKIYNDIQSRDWKNGELIFSDEWKAIHNGIPLEDYDVLDKIRAEIELFRMNDSSNIFMKAYNDGINIALRILDRYREGVSD